MRKLLSILLVIMLVLGMFPATPLTAFAAAETFTYDFSTFSGSSTQYADETHTLSSDVTLHITGCHINTQLRIYGSKTTEAATFKADNKPISAITVNAGYKADTLVVSGSNDGGASWTEINTLATTSSYKDLTLDLGAQYKWVKLEVQGSSQVRVKTVTLTLNEVETTCEHTNTQEQTDGYAATCTEPGKTNSVLCLDCNTTVTPQENIAALGHSYVDGVCSVCSAEEPEGYTLVTDASALKVGDQIVIVAQDYNYAISTEQKSNNRGQAVVEKIDNIVTFGEDVQVLTLEAGTAAGTFAFNTGSGYLYAAGSSGNYLKTQAAIDVNASWKIEVADGSTSITAPNSSNRNVLQYNQSSSLFACYASASQKAVVVYVLPGSEDVEPCTHENTEPIPAVAATCASTGLTEGVRCADCGTTITEQTQTPVREHNMVDGICAYTDCGMYENPADLMTTLPGSGDKIIIHHIKNNVALGRDVAQTDDLAAISTTPADGKLTYYTSVAQLTVGLTDGDYTFANAEGKYLTTDEANALYFADNLTDNGKWVITLTDGVFTIDNAYAADADGNTLALEVYGGVFTSYKTGTTDAYKMHLYLVEKGECTCTNTQEQDDGYDATCTEPGMTNSVKCTDCGATVTAQQEIPALGHNYVDYVCSRCGDVQKIGNYVLVSSLDEITDGQYVIVANVDGVYYAMNNVIESGKFVTVAVEVSNNTVSTADAPVWTVVRSGENVTLQTEAGYLNYKSSTNFQFADTQYAWSVAAGETFGTFILNSTETTRGIYYQIGNKFGAYATSNANNKDYCAYLQLYKYVQPVVSADGTGYNSIEKAIEAGENNLKLYANVDSITCDGDLYLDLNGFSVESLTITNGTLYGSDSKATTAAASGAQITVSGDIAIDNTANGVRYIALENEGVYTFHALEMNLTAVTLRASKAGIYYKAAVTCDPVLAAAATQYGIALSTRNMPGADFATEAEVNKWTVRNAEQFPLTSGEVFTSGSVFGIFKDGEDNAARGAVEIYANAYIKVGETVIMADTTVGDKATDDGFDGIAWSLKDVMVALEGKFTTLDAAQQKQVATFYKNWTDAMSGWSLTEIAAAAAALAE